ncbi:uncharacterized protein EI97DRAFT_473286 [Westerdykella ornata]|uniref:Uncharacterized protein n=1 Tax=Westerdykella ornata TaxID=318751 RepID=A0A6A6K0N9_WESOR|nr:uncharacterized protein EI97DRAFT_473286 [Westerdykella ornata]KAF2281626.1 hypothetical protein EI97DRAFT_473286 [Westerdykella ornata]
MISVLSRLKDLKRRGAGVQTFTDKMHVFSSVVALYSLSADTGLFFVSEDGHPTTGVERKSREFCTGDGTSTADSGRRRAMQRITDIAAGGEAFTCCVMNDGLRQSYPGVNETAFPKSNGEAGEISIRQRKEKFIALTAKPKSKIPITGNQVEANQNGNNQRVRSKLYDVAYCFRASGWRRNDSSLSHVKSAWENTTRLIATIWHSDSVRKSPWAQRNVHFIPVNHKDDRDIMSFSTPCQDMIKVYTLCPREQIGVVEYPVSVQRICSERRSVNVGPIATLEEQTNHECPPVVVQLPFLSEKTDHWRAVVVEKY